MASCNIAKRTFDIILAGLLGLVLVVPMFLIGLLVRTTSRGNAIYWSDRVGVDNRVFRMPKFRTMRLDTPVMATHLINEPDRYTTTLGKLMRKLSVDEIPQLWSVVKGDMSLVGPRPALFNQEDLIELRTKKGVHRLVPGITGWAQINGRDELPIPIKVEFDEYYMHHRSFTFDLKILILTLWKVMRLDGVVH